MLAIIGSVYPSILVVNWLLANKVGSVYPSILIVNWLLANKVEYVGYNRVSIPQYTYSKLTTS